MSARQSRRRSASPTIVREASEEANPFQEDSRSLVLYRHPYATRSRARTPVRGALRPRDLEEDREPTRGRQPRGHAGAQASRGVQAGAAGGGCPPPPPYQNPPRRRGDDYGRFGDLLAMVGRPGAGDFTYAPVTVTVGRDAPCLQVGPVCVSPLDFDFDSDFDFFSSEIGHRLPQPGLHPPGGPRR